MDHIKVFTTPRMIMQINDGHHVSEIVDAKLTAYCGDQLLLTKQLSSAVLDTAADIVSWRLSQSESGALPVNAVVDFYVDITFSDGDRIGNEDYNAKIIQTGVREVM